MRALALGGLLPLVVFSAAAQPDCEPLPYSPGTRVSGEQEPHSIPDAVAWRILFRLVAGGPDRAAAEIRARYLEEGGLPEEVITKVMRTADRAMQRVVEMEDEVEELQLPLETTAEMLRARRDAIIEDAVRDLLIEELDVVAGQKLLDYLNGRVKPAISLTVGSSTGGTTATAVFTTESEHAIHATAITDGDYAMGGVCGSIAVAKIVSPAGRSVESKKVHWSAAVVDVSLPLEFEDGRFTGYNWRPGVVCPACKPVVQK